MSNLLNIIFGGYDRFDKKILDCISNQLEDLVTRIERIERTMPTKAEAQAVADQLNKALNEVTGEIGSLKGRISDLEAAVQNGEDTTAIFNDIKTIAQRLDDVVADAAPQPTEPTPGEDTQPSPEGEDTLPTEDGQDTLGGETGEDTTDGQNGTDVV